MTPFFEWQDAPPARFAVIGDPVSHSLSPAMHTAALQEIQEPGEYLAVRVPAGQVVEAMTHLAHLGYEGVNVTVPHKFEVQEFCLFQSEFSRRVGAVNTVDMRARKGHNTDGPGLMESLEAHSFSDKRALVLGVGGSGKSVAVALADAGWEVAVWNRTPETANELADQFLLTFAGIEIPDLTAFDLVVQATSASLQGVSLPIHWETARLSTLAYDLMYREGERRSCILQLQKVSQCGMVGRCWLDKVPWRWRSGWVEQCQFK